jgi:hypothetical protein
MVDIFYDINDFRWSKTDNSFYADANYLYPCHISVAKRNTPTTPEIYFENLSEFSEYYKSAFPNGKDKFYIKNFNTNNFREFIFKEESVSHFIEKSDPDYGIQEYTVEETVWIYKSEDGILCKIALP